MTIDKQLNGITMTIAVEGRLDTITTPDLELELRKLDNVNSLILDFRKLDYISSAGLRVLLSAHKKMQQKDGMKIIHANELVKEVFEVTGFSDILTVVSDGD